MFEPCMQQELREDLLSSATDLMGDVLLLDCLLERLERDGRAAWSGFVLDALLAKLDCYIGESSREVAFLAGLLTGARTVSPAG